MKKIESQNYAKKTANVTKEYLQQIQQKINNTRIELDNAKKQIHSKNEIEKTDFLNYIRSLENSLRTLESIYFNKKQQFATGI